MPEEVASIPDEALVFVAGQVDAAAHELLAYGARGQTRSDHLGLVLTHLGWRRPDDADREQLEQWLAWRAVEHDAPATLMTLTSEHVRPRQDRAILAALLIRTAGENTSCSRLTVVGDSTPEWPERVDGGKCTRRI